jgi:hypothetical protein
MSDAHSIQGGGDCISSLDKVLCCATFVTPLLGTLVKPKLGRPGVLGRVIFRTSCGTVVFTSNMKSTRALRNR